LHDLIIEDYPCGMNNESAIRTRFEKLAPFLNERTRRLFTAAEAAAIGRGGITVVTRATGVSRRAIAAGLAELQAPHEGPAHRLRRPGGGRKRRVQADPTLQGDLERLIAPVTRGDPESPLRWTCKSVRKLTAELWGLGHATSHRMVAELLHELGYSLQANRKTIEGTSHPDRNAQFAFINTKVQAALRAGEPVISVDAKKKEVVGECKNAGREGPPAGQPVSVRVYDFLIPALGRVTPYGIYDIARNTGWVNVGTDHDTAAFAGESIRRWWYAMGQATSPQAKTLLITADGGGSNGSRVRLWKRALQQLADETGVEITVCHFPPGTSKWNKIEHRLFSFISQNWRGKPLVSHEVIVNLMAATTTKTGLTVVCALDQNAYPAGVKVSKKDMEELQLQRDAFHGEWNYTILPRLQS
jgi:transposase